METIAGQSAQNEPVTGTDIEIGGLADTSVDNDSGAGGDRTPINDTSTNKSTEVYEVESNIYGLLAIPNSGLHAGACFMLVVFYALTCGLIWIIWESMVANANSIRTELYVEGGNDDPLCRQIWEGNSYIWDCSPPNLIRLMDFDQLDLNQDGVWSVKEARDSSLLQYFRALNEVALEQKSMLANAFPPAQTKTDRFCTSLQKIGTTNANALHALPEVDQVEMLETSGRVTFSLLSQCDIPTSTSDRSQTSPMQSWKYTCMLNAVCEDAPVVPGKSSEVQFYEASSHMSAMPRFLHQLMSEKMLKPCRLVDPELCANAEVERGLASNVWPGLHLNEAVQACSHWVAQICPRLLGDGFGAIQTRMSVSCGQRSYGAVKKASTSEQHGWVPLNAGGETTTCEDPEDGGKSALAPVVETMFELHPVLRYLAWAEEGFRGLPRGTVEQYLDCKIGSEDFLFPQSSFESVDPHTNISSTVAAVFGKICPETSCTRLGRFAPLGCQTQCLQKVDMANNVTDPFKLSFDLGEFTQIGRCTGFTSKVDPVSGALEVSRLNPMHGWVMEDCRLVLRLNRTARVYMTEWNIPMRQVDPSTPGLCYGDYLIIDGIRHCTSEKPAPIDLKPTGNGFTELVWSMCETCGPFNYDSPGYFKYLPAGFRLRIVDAAVETEHHLVTVSFHLHTWFWDDHNGVTRPVFHTFLVLIMMIWIGFLGDELFKIFTYIKFILQHNTLKELPIHQLWLLFFVALPRFIVWMFVVYVGVLLLSTANSYVDLVLNSVALAFVLEFDEYLYVMAVPLSLKERVNTHKQVELHAYWFERCHCKLLGLNGRVFVRIGTFLIVALIVVQMLYGVDWLGSPHFNGLSEVYDCLCAQNGPRCGALS